MRRRARRNRDRDPAAPGGRRLLGRENEMKGMAQELRRTFAATARFMDDTLWAQCLQHCTKVQDLPNVVQQAQCGAPAWLAQLAALELDAAGCAREAFPLPRPAVLSPNPLLRLHTCSWQGLPELLAGAAHEPAPGEQHVLLWPDPTTGALRCEAASSEDLLALKIVAEDLPLEEVAAQAGAPVGALRMLLRGAVDRGLLLAPPSLLVRPESTHPRATQEVGVPEAVFISETFTLQWHITQRCDLRCLHCYDRSPGRDVPLERGLWLLDELAAFCEARNVLGQATLTGGNPLLHPHVLDFYRGAVERGLQVALLANPCSEEVLDGLLEIAAPAYFQISLEGLQDHNDSIRGQGHYRRSLAFLELLRRRGVRSQVMLTLTSGNLADVLPLGKELEGLVDRFTFNRLAPVGEGAALACAEERDYREFLERYIDEAHALPHLGYKDNLLNIALKQRGEPLFGGCTGHGCGAAFDFMAVLCDGQAHACRKMHSPVGNVHRQGVEAVYEGAAAASYRRGCAACAGCELRPACGGCLAVAKGLGLDPLEQRDPYCFHQAQPGCGEKISP